uniref:PawS-like preproalbumin 1 n=1 Tax=Heliopsis helianthoides TaxID=53723 RepID=A0A0K1TR36_9ASTR|nr:PawS-like preproalbumin 1 [Heliopsis helianthoides]
MTKLIACFALTFTTIVAFSAVVSAYRITITTIDDNGLAWMGGADGLDNPQEQCRRQIPPEQLNHCQMHLTQGIWRPFQQQQQQQQHLQQCCSQLKQVNRQCQCDAIQQVFDEARQQADVIKMRQMLSKAQRLPSECSLQVQDCPLVAPRV